MFEVKSRQADTPAYIRDAWRQVSEAYATGIIENRWVVLSFLEDGKRVWYTLQKVNEKGG